MKKSSLIFVFALTALSFALAAGVSAHQPRLVKDNGLTLIKNPEVSQAFYGELKDHEAYYLIEFKQPADLFLQILAPDLPGILKDKSLTVEYAGEFGAKAAAFAAAGLAPSSWKKFHEEYAGDDYWAGPEINQPAEPGYYYIKVSSPDNTGKYVLVAGEKEDFPAGEAVKAAVVLPQLKIDFFSKPLWSCFEGKIGRYFGFGLLGVIILAFMFYKFNQVYK